jgi:malonate-semialdehyde dehydrogenase (acetylating) / methylmalonate-semialdehyde dehydrogenase
MDTLKNFINGEFVAATVNASEEVINPATLEVLGQTPLCNATDISNAVASAKQAFETWSKTPVIDRVQPLFRLKSLLEEHTDEIAKIIIDEHGKTYKEAQGDLLRGIQMVEIACGMPTMMMGESLTNIAPNIDCNTTRRSIGVFAAITPFNFPAMVPFWFWPFAVASGNTFVLKPSERVPLTQMKIFELIEKAGFPKGVINMVHGGKDAVNAILENPDIKGVSFVGSTPIAKYVYEKGTKNNKRVQALGGAKNYMVMMPDAPLEKSVKAMMDSCYGCAGERCLAGSILVGVGEAYDKLKAQIIKEVKNVVVGNGRDLKTTLGPVISQQAKNRILSDIETALSEGAELLVDGRNHNQKDLKGYFLAPTILDKIVPGTLLATKEIFGPVIGLMQVSSLDEAIKILNTSEYANTTSIFTSNGGSARQFVESVTPSMVGVNLGVPAPMAFFSFGGSKDSFFGDIKVHGKSSIEFFTEKHTTMTRWYQDGQDEKVSPMWKD